MNEMLENLMSTAAGQLIAYGAAAVAGLYVVAFAASLVAAFTDNKEDDAAVEKVMKRLTGAIGSVANWLPGLGKKR